MPRITNESAGRYYTEAHGGVRFEPGETKDVSDDAADALAALDAFELVEPEQPTCAEGDCSRTVDEEGLKCWQHDDDPDTDGSEE